MHAKILKMKTSRDLTCLKSEFLGPSIDNLKALGRRNAEKFPNQWDSSDKIGFIDSWLSYRPNLGRINIYWHMFFCQFR